MQVLRPRLLNQKLAPPAHPQGHARAGESGPIPICAQGETGSETRQLKQSHSTEVASQVSNPSLSDFGNKCSFLAGGGAENRGIPRNGEKGQETSFSEEAGADLRPWCSPPRSAARQQREEAGSHRHPTRPHSAPEGRARAGPGFLAADSTSQKRHPGPSPPPAPNTQRGSTRKGSLLPMQLKTA